MFSSAASRLHSSTLTPFLYPCLDSTWTSTEPAIRHVAHQSQPRRGPPQYLRRCQSRAAESQTADENASETPGPIDVNQFDHLNPQPLDYSSAPFADNCTLTLRAGAGGHGSISFLREKYIAQGPPNGGDGGTGGNVYIQAVRGETSLHKLARRPILKAGRGKNGEGGLRGGRRGEDVLITVPVGTVVREIERRDPVQEELERDWWEKRDRRRGRKGRRNSQEVDDEEVAANTDEPSTYRRDKWLLYPGTMPKSFTSADLPTLPAPRKSALAASQPTAPLRLDLDKPMSIPMLLAAGAMGGLGNPHFVTKSRADPKYATKGDEGLSIQVQLELKLLADVGLVGLPNAGKSTLLRALTNSRTRIGDWAFTTLSPNIGTVVLDSYLGRPNLPTNNNLDGSRADPRTHFNIADIPGLIEGAHLDRGLGLGFLKHIERAGILAFVVDLSAGNAVTALKALWTEVGEYEKLREREVNAESERSSPRADEGEGEEDTIAFTPFSSSISPDFDPEPISTSFPTANTSSTVLLTPQPQRKLEPLNLPPISSKPWLVVATKADLAGTQENFARLQDYLQRVQGGEEQHPSGKKNAWRKRMFAVPVSAINREGVSGIVEIVLGLLER